MKLLLQFQSPYSYHSFYESSDDIVLKFENYKNVDIFNGNFESFFKVHKRKDLNETEHKIKMLFNPSHSFDITILYNIGKQYLTHSSMFNYHILTEGVDFIFDYSEKNINILDNL